jgi:transposase
MKSNNKRCVSYVNLDRGVPSDHPLRAIRQMADQAWAELSADFDALYARRGRPSIPPEQWIRALLLQVLYAIRSERQRMERIKNELLFRWFVGLGIDEEAGDATVFTKHRDRLLEGQISQRLLEAVREQARSKKRLSEEHYTVDGTILEAGASRNSLVPKEPATEVGTGARGRKCWRDTQESKTAPEARLYKKSATGEAKPSYLGHGILENRNGLVVTACATQSSTAAERAAALAMLDQMHPRAPDQRITLGADQRYREQKFIEGLRRRQVVPPVAEYATSAHWPNFLTEAERNDPGFPVSQKKRKLVERVFGWGKLDSVMRKIKLHGLRRVDWFFRFLATAHNLVRMVKLVPAQ